MMRVFAAVGLSVLLFLAGCAKNTADTDLKPEDVKKRAFQAGELAALGYLVAEKPTVEQAKAIAFVIEKVGECCTEYRLGGFISIKPDIDKLIDVELKGPDKEALRLLAKKLDQILLEELDAQFQKHPEWKLKSNTVVDVLQAFADGAHNSFVDYIKGKTNKKTK